MPLAPATRPPYTVFYDANCRLCVRSRRTLERLRLRAELAFVNVQDDAAMRRFPQVDRRATRRRHPTEAIRFERRLQSDLLA